MCSKVIIELIINDSLKELQLELLKLGGNYLERDASSEGEDKTRSPTPWSTLWSTPKNHVLVKLNTYQHGEAFRCILPLFISSFPALRLLLFDAVHELAAILKFRRYFMYPLL